MASKEDASLPTATNPRYKFFSKRASAENTRNPDFVVHPVLDFHNRCLTMMVKCVQRDPFIRLMLAALSAKKCPIDFSRHISCEPCESDRNSYTLSTPQIGIYDYRNQQVAICSNRGVGLNKTCESLREQLVHAFDVCRAEFDPNNVEHLACTEIRVANLLKCTIFDKVTNLTKSHEDCIRQSAVSGLLSHNHPDIATTNQAEEVVDRVFIRCSGDLEPLGRRVNIFQDKGKEPSRLAYREARYYGYREMEKLDDLDRPG